MFLDNIVYINKNDYPFLCESLVNFLKVIYSFKEVDSAYITCYSSDSSNGSLGITIILNNNDFDIKLKLLVDGINSAFNIGGPKKTKVHFSFDNVNNYLINSNDGITKIHLEELLSSKILFDKSGYISSLKSNVNNYSFEYSLHLTEFIPPIDDEIAKLLKM